MLSSYQDQKEIHQKSDLSSKKRLEKVELELEKHVKIVRNCKDRESDLNDAIMVNSSILLCNH